MLPKHQQGGIMGTGKGWHGDPEAHARAGRKGGQVSTGNFKHSSERASKAGKIGGSVSPSNFKNNPELARLAGRKGGAKKQSTV